MQLTDAQREMLCDMANAGYLEIRTLAQAGRLEQGFDLAAAFHYLLDDIWSEEFSLPAFRDKFLAGYQAKYPGLTSANYVALVDRIIAMGGQAPPAEAAPDPLPLGAPGVPLPTNSQ